MKPGAAANWIVTKSSRSLKLQKRLLHDLLSIKNFVPRETAGCCCCCYLHSSSIFPRVSAAFCFQERRRRRCCRGIHRPERREEWWFRECERRGSRKWCQGAAAASCEDQEEETTLRFGCFVPVHSLSPPLSKLQLFNNETVSLHNPSVSLSPPCISLTIIFFKEFIVELGTLYPWRHARFMVKEILIHVWESGNELQTTDCISEIQPPQRSQTIFLNLGKLNPQVVKERDGEGSWRRPELQP